jgi:hypothetical protein
MKFCLKICILIIIVVTLSSCFFGPSLLFFDRDADGKPNLVANPDFEKPLSPNKTLPNHWMFISNADYHDALSLDSLKVHSGSRSIKLKNPKQQFLLVSESFPIDNKSAYLSRCYVTSTNPSAGQVVFYFRTFNKIGTCKDSFTSRIKTNSEWQEILLSTGFFKPSAQFARLIISIPADPTNTYWIDNIGSYYVHTFTR